MYEGPMVTAKRAVNYYCRVLHLGKEDESESHAYREANTRSDAVGCRLVEYHKARQAGRASW